MVLKEKNKTFLTKNIAQSDPLNSLQRSGIFLQTDSFEKKPKTASIKNIEIYVIADITSTMFYYFKKKSIKNTRCGEQKREISKIILLLFIT